MGMKGKPFSMIKNAACLHIGAESNCNCLPLKIATITIIHGRENNEIMRTANEPLKLIHVSLMFLLLTYLWSPEVIWSLELPLGFETNIFQQHKTIFVSSANEMPTMQKVYLFVLIQLPCSL